MCKVSGSKDCVAGCGNDDMAYLGRSAVDSRDRAATFVDELLDQCEALAEFPQRWSHP
jgi:hypothetical protein